jgi:Fe-S cluster assembly protein SufD
MYDSPDSSHQISHIHADVGAQGTYRLLSVCLGGQLARVNVGIDLNDEGGHAECQGIMIADDYRIADLHSRISHNAPSCTSNQYQKNIACGHSRIIFSGKVVVNRVAQKTNSEQLCRSMLLSSKAQVDAMPVLEIQADDVKCSHGATVADLNADELFYCQSRGISERMAQELLVASFALDVLEECPFESFREKARSASAKLIPGIEVTTDEYTISAKEMQSI